jgi:hypothetical protein
MLVRSAILSLVQRDEGEGRRAAWKAAYPRTEMPENDISTVPRTG